MYLRVGLCIKNLPIVGKASMSDISFEHVLSSQYTVFDGLAGMHVEDIYQDRQGFLWIATADSARLGSLGSPYLGTQRHEDSLQFVHPGQFFPLLGDLGR